MKTGVNDAETQWRQLVKNMESWNRIVMNLVRVWLLCIRSLSPERMVTHPTHTNLLSITGAAVVESALSGALRVLRTSVHVSQSNHLECTHLTM